MISVRGKPCPCAARPRRSGRSGRAAPPDAQEALARRPELRAVKSLVLDLAYEEFCLRYAAGERPDVDAFCDRFPTFKSSLCGIIESTCP